MATSRHTGILHPLQAQRALPIVLPDPRHRLLIAQLVPRLVRHRRIRPLLQVRRRSMRARRRVEQQRIVRAVSIGVERDLGAAAHHGACADARAGEVL